MFVEWLAQDFVMCFAGHVTIEINVVVKVAKVITAHALHGATQVADELSFRHFVLDVWTAQVDTEQD